jgi:hypothetical protein
VGVRKKTEKLWRAQNTIYALKTVVILILPLRNFKRYHFDLQILHHVVAAARDSLLPTISCYRGILASATVTLPDKLLFTFSGEKECGEQNKTSNKAPHPNIHRLEEDSETCCKEAEESNIAYVDEISSIDT